MVGDLRKMIALRKQADDYVRALSTQCPRRPKPQLFPWRNMPIRTVFEINF